MSRPDADTRRSLKHAVDFAQANDGNFIQSKRGRSTSPRNGFLAQLTGESGTTAGLYSWAMVEPSQSTPGTYAVDAAPTIGANNAYELNSQAGLPDDTFVWIEARGVDNTTGAVWFSFSITRPYVLIPCDVTKTGGIDGTLTADPTFTYSATGIDGATLGTVLTPKNKRVFGSVHQGTFGSGYYNAAVPSIFVLGLINETPQVEEC